jgi:hypothetical protein
MLFRRALCLVLAALVGTTTLAGCGVGDPGEFQITMVAPFQTLVALTPGPAVYGTLTARAASPSPPPASVVRGVAGELESVTSTSQPMLALAPTETLESSTVTPPQPTATLRSVTPTPPQPTATPRSVTPPSPPPTPAGGIGTLDASVYVGQFQSVGELGDAWSLSELRIGMHPEMVRLVWELQDDRDTIPLTRVVEVDNTQSPFPSRGSLYDPSWGAARIDIMLSDVYAYDVPLGELLPTSLADSPLVTKVGLHPTFDDAVLGFSIGLARPAAYEVFTLTDPVRIVVDVRTEP